MRSSVVLPHPFAPMMPSRLPRLRSKLRFSNSSLSPYRLVRSSTWNTLSPDRATSLNAMFGPLTFVGFSMRSILSSAFTRDWACLASCP